MDVRSELFALEHEITKTKTSYMLGAISYREAKQIIIEIDAKIKKLLSSLPEEEREIYELKKEIQSLG